MDEFYFKHYIRTDENNLIIDGFSTAFREPVETDICVNNQGGYQFALFSGGEENPILFTEDGIPLYKYEDGLAVTRSYEEIESDRSIIPMEISRLDSIEAQITYTAMVTGTLLEV